MPINYSEKGIKRPNAPVNWTPEMVREYTKCSRDIIYFAEKYYTVVEEKRGKHIIKLFDYQKEMVKNFNENRFNCVLSARQMGKCVHIDSIIEIYDENTGKTEEITIGDFFEKIKNNIK